MRLLKYRVTNFRSVDDSGWIDVDLVTALIGINESGKTNLLLPLWKLNPALGGEINPTADYPRSRYGEIREAPSDFSFIEAEFDLEDIKTSLAQTTNRASEEFQTVIVRKYFDGAFEFDFPNKVTRLGISADVINKFLVEFEFDLKKLKVLKQEEGLLTGIQAVAKKIAEQVNGVELVDAAQLESMLENIRGLLPDEPAVSSALVPRINAFVDGLDDFLLVLAAPEPEVDEEIRTRLYKEMPKFVYYSNYGNLDSEIYLPHVVENLSRTDLGAKEEAKARTLKVLFEFVRLSPEEILELGLEFQDPSAPTRAPTDDEVNEIAEKKKERNILLQSAEANLTKEFRNWWKQGAYSFRFVADGNHFQILVSDEKRPEDIELENRSTGLQWFLSFYLVFLVESKNEHDNTVLLLDEPGLSLHPLAQRDLSEFFDSLSETNQILYTTHSPFLVDADMLDRARKVYLADDGTSKATSDLRRGFSDPRKSGASYAVYSALNMNVAESLLIGCKPIIVEGPSDQHYLSAMKSILIAQGKITPARELVFPPAHGAKNAKAIASILSGTDEELPVVLLDGDDVGLKMQRDMKNGIYQSQKEKILSTDEFVDLENSEVEDLIPSEVICECMDRIERRPDVPFADAYKSGAPIVPQIESWASVSGIELESGWKVELARRAKQTILARADKSFSPTHIASWVTMFESFEN